MKPNSINEYCPHCYSEHGGACPSPEEIAAAAEALREKWRQSRVEQNERTGPVEIMEPGSLLRKRVVGGRD
jgi:hypothetical protein